MAEPHFRRLMEFIHRNRDCMDICRLAIVFLDRGSHSAVDLCQLVAEICQAYADECDRHADMDYCEACATACRECADECHHLHLVHH